MDSKLLFCDRHHCTMLLDIKSMPPLLQAQNVSPITLLLKGLVHPKMKFLSFITHLS